MSYRGVVRHVRYWRGQPHRWSTVYQFVGNPTSPITTEDCRQLLLADDAMCYGGPTIYGGTYECQFYDQAVGGVPIATFKGFDWDNQGTWPGYGGSAWNAADGEAEGVAEACLIAEWPAGLSKSGKPVTLRKFYHAVPHTVTSGNSPQVSAGDVASLTAGASHIIGLFGGKGLVLGSSSGRFAGSPRVLTFYGNHQMPRGRRRGKAKLTSKDANSLLGILIREQQKAAEDS